ncbi:UNVERIFIED_CONTAM: Disease resistance RPP8-like protein 3 [Sesamum radiatum]|uniref:Disease resistance RPP8-like protein 3 n=1 Tax=Sesamum radiatum TaxID=300843 RepID=A0AAW2KB10_SESRA
MENLISLRLNGYLGRNIESLDQLANLHRLTKLKIGLNVGELTSAGQKMVISRDGFPKLRALSLNGLKSLKNIQLEKGAMLELNRLEITGCPFLESFPEELRFMTNLKELKMETTPQFASKYSHIISNIPSVELILSDEELTEAKLTVA